MLVKFAVENYLSFKDRQEFSFIADSKNELPDNKFSSGYKNIELLKSAAIYGANASGKSNFIAALRFFVDFVRESSSRRTEGDPIDVEPFLLNSESEKSSSSFEMTFIENGNLYDYGFSVTKERVTFERLIEYPAKKGLRKRELFSREFKPDAKKISSPNVIYHNGYIFKCSEHYLWQDKALIVKSTRDNALYFATAVQFGEEVMKRIFNGFLGKLHALMGNKIFPIATADFCKESDDNKGKVLQLLESANIEIEDIKFQEGRTIFDRDEISFIRNVTDTGEKISFNLVEQESRGTEVFFGLIYPFIDVLTRGSVLIIDELDAQLHPNLFYNLVKMFNSPLNDKGAQLIFTAHIPIALNNKLLRHDQIWFAQKNNDNESELYSLLEFSDAQRDIAIEKNYLHGKYGGVPILGDFDLNHE